MHTPERWEVLNTPVLTASDNLMVRVRNSPLNLLTMHLSTDPNQWAEQEARARLIAAAPKLLAALERLTNWAEGTIDNLETASPLIGPELRRRVSLPAREAIREAKGE